MAVSLDDLKIEKNSFQNYGSNRVYCPNSDRIGVTYTSTLTPPWQPSFVSHVFQNLPFSNKKGFMSIKQILKEAE